MKLLNKLKVKKYFVFNPASFIAFMMNFLPHFLALLSTAMILSLLIKSENKIIIIQELRLGIPLSILSSYIFYFYVVFYPSWVRKRIIKKNFEISVIEFKKEVISTFLNMLGVTQTAEFNSEDLLNVVKFREYFKKEYSAGQSKWEKVLTELESDKFALQSLLVQLEIIREESNFLLNSIELHDAWVFNFLKRLSKAVYSLKREYESNAYDISYLGHFFWDLFAGWSFVEGYEQEDIFDLLMERI